MFGFGGFGFGVGAGRFEAHYRCYPVTFLDKPEAERGDKIFMPPSALDRLAQLHIDYPMLFQVKNPRDDRATHCGVLEFIADEGMVYLPYWMMQNLLLQEGDVIKVSSATLPKGTFVKLQPHSKDFLDISNPRAVLETTLRNFSCLSVGDTIPIHYNNKKYFIDIIEAQPANAISVIETDCNVDFAPPLDYVEPEPVFPSSAAAALGSASMAGTDNSVHGGGSSKAASEAGDKMDKNEQNGAVDDEPKFLAFGGSGNRLDGKSVSASAPVAVPLPGYNPRMNASRLLQTGNDNNGKDQAGSAPKNAGAAGGRKAGKVMFKDRLAAKFGDGKTPGAGGGGGAGAAAAAPVPAKPKEEEKPAEEESKFKAFQGTSYKLK